MNPQNFTNKSQEALQRAANISHENGQPHVEPPHLFLALLEQNDGVVVSVIKKLNIEVNSLKTEIQNLINLLPKQFGAMSPGGFAPGEP